MDTGLPRGWVFVVRVQFVVRNYCVKMALPVGVGSNDCLLLIWRLIGMREMVIKVSYEESESIFGRKGTLISAFLNDHKLFICKVF